MKFKIPFTFSDIEVLKRKSKPFLKFVKPGKTKLDEYLKSSEKKVDRMQYLAICYRSFALNLLIFSVITTSILGLFGLNSFYLYGLLAALAFAGFILFNQLNYPRIFCANKQRQIERNLISVLQDMMVQLNSGVPIYQILVNIASSDYGEVSDEFKKITKEINSGVPQIDAIEKYGKLNSSEYFRRVLWQISNGMRAGSDMSIVIKEGIRTLSEEQSIQIQTYGSKLNPLVMFYMLIAVILPSLGITFLIIISSLLSVSSTIVKLLFVMIFVFVFFIQIMFIGMIKSRRPSLL